MDNSLDMSSGKHLSHCKVTLMQGGMFFSRLRVPRGHILEREKLAIQSKPIASCQY